VAAVGSVSRPPGPLTGVGPGGRAPRGSGRSSSAVGRRRLAEIVGDLRLPAHVAATSSSVTPGWSVSSVISPVASSNRTCRGRSPRSSGRSPTSRAPRRAPDPRCARATCGSRSVHERALRLPHDHEDLPAWIAISHAPPEPGSRTFGCA
jgi:hypothetical protein